MFKEEEIEQMRWAKFVLENPSLTAKITNYIGKPIEKGMELLPEGWQASIQNATIKSLMSALKTAIVTMDSSYNGSASPRIHKMLSALSGAAGGAFGLLALAIELPVSTVIIFRSIADIARSKGEDISSIESKLSCLQVFALGGDSKSDDATETGYFAVRAAFARSITEAAKYIAEKGFAEEGAPVIVKFIAKIAARFEGPVAEKVIGQAVPIIGAAGGAIINTMFIDHFQDISEGHFTIRRLERIYGEEGVKIKYDSL